MRAGFYGKLPSRGDFLRSSLPAETIAILDPWIARNMRAQQERLGDGFDAVWETAPHWRFALTPGWLDARDAASGLWVPSVDRAGRYFPLMVVVLHAPELDCRPFLETLEPLVIAAIQEDAQPAMLQDRIDDCLHAHLPERMMTPAVDCWWYRQARSGSTTAVHAVLPEGGTFAGILHRTNGEDAGIR